MPVLVPVAIALALMFLLPPIRTPDGRPGLGFPKRLGFAILSALPGLLLLQVDPASDPLLVVALTVGTTFLCVFPLVLVTMVGRLAAPGHPAAAAPQPEADPSAEAAAAS